jgi:carboxypeptidase Q
MGLSTDSSKYFLYHHSAADTIDKIDVHELGECIATLAIMAYIIADFPDALQTLNNTAVAAATTSMP